MPNYKFDACPTAFSRADGSTEQWTKGDVTAPADDYTKRLLNREILSSTGNACQPTSLSFVPKVVAPEGKTKVALRARVELTRSGYQTQTRNINIVVDTQNGTNNTANEIADDIFLVSGFDLMRQQRIRDYFDYTPPNDSGSPVLKAEQAITIIGRNESALGGPNYEAVPMSIDMTFELIPENELTSDTVDFTAIQWGQEQKVHSCVALFNTGT